MDILKIKCRNKELTLTNKDVIMFNGACYQLITQKYRSGWYEINYVLSKTKCSKLIKDGILVLVKSVGEGNGKLDYYKIAGGL